MNLDMNIGFIRRILKYQRVTNLQGLVLKNGIIKMGYWLRTGEFESDILIDRDFNLVDGYSSMKIAYLKGIDKVPVYFVN